MDTYIPTELHSEREYDNIEQRIKEHLRAVVPEAVYDKWIEYFVIEKIDDKKIIIAYYGTESLRKFKKEYKQAVSNSICSVLGNMKKLRIYRRKTNMTSVQTEKMKKNIKVAKLFVISLVFVVITLAVAVIGCSYIGNRNFQESFYNVSSLKANNKIRIIQISDLHNSSYGKNNSKLISRVEKLKPDLIIYTGDCIDSDEYSNEKSLYLCSQLAKVAPSYYIYGNNEVEKLYDTPLTQEALDKKFGFNDNNREPEKLTSVVDKFKEELEKNGVRVLKNEMDTVTIGSTKVDVYGVLTSNPSSFWSYAGNSFDEYIYINTNHLKITAIHEPLVFEQYSPDSWGDVLICGHTHGGTVKVPMIGPLYTHEGGLFPESKGAFIYGRYDVSGSPLIVSSGLDNKNILRINNRPELVIIDVNRF